MSVPTGQLVLRRRVARKISGPEFKIEFHERAFNFVDEGLNAGFAEVAILMPVQIVKRRNRVLILSLTF